MPITDRVYCLYCGFDLTMTESEQCTECGARFEKSAMTGLVSRNIEFARAYFALDAALVALNAAVWAIVCKEASFTAVAFSGLCFLGPLAIVAIAFIAKFPGLIIPVGFVSIFCWFLANRILQGSMYLCDDYARYLRIKVPWLLIGVAWTFFVYFVVAGSSV